MIPIAVRMFDPRTLSWWNTQRENIDFEPAFQRRGSIWGTADKAFLIDSILNNFDIPKIYIADYTYKDSTLNDKRKQYAIVDGKQRFEAIFDFFDNKLPLDQSFRLFSDLTLRLGGLTYFELKSKHPRICEIFDNFHLTVMSVITDDASKINDLFIRLNHSKPLTGAEVRSAMKGIVPTIINRLAAHSFFRKSIRFDTKRKQDHNVAAKLMLIEFRGQFVDTKKTHLDSFVQEGLEQEGLIGFRSAEERVIRVLDKMSDVFLSRDPLLGSEGPVTLYYWFVRLHMRQSHHLLRDFLTEFEEERKFNRKPDLPHRSEELLRFDLLSRSINDQSSLTARYKILERRFSKFLKRIGTANPTQERKTMGNVFVEARPKGRPEGTHVDDYVVEDHADQVLGTFKTQKEGNDWAKANGHHPLVARVRHLNNKRVPDHWRSA
jgi:hypothetical protein